MRANSEHYFENSNQEDLDKMTMKNGLMDRFRELKRKRIKYNRQVEEEYLREIEDKVDPDTVGYEEGQGEDEDEDEDEEEGSGDVEETETPGNEEGLEEEESQRQEEDLGNRTIE